MRSVTIFISSYLSLHLSFSLYLVPFLSSTSSLPSFIFHKYLQLSGDFQPFIQREWQKGNIVESQHRPWRCLCRSYWRSSYIKLDKNHVIRSNQIKFTLTNLITYYRGILRCHQTRGLNYKFGIRNGNARELATSRWTRDRYCFILLTSHLGESKLDLDRCWTKWKELV